MGLYKSTICLNLLDVFPKKPWVYLQICFLLVIGQTEIYGQSNANLNEISGYITNIDAPLENVNVSVKNKERKTITNVEGYYKILAAPKEIIRFSYSGMKPVEIIVEDVTEVLNIKMVNEVSALEEVTLKTKKTTKDYDQEEEDNTIVTAYGKLNKKSISFGKLKTIKGKTLNVQGTDLIETLSGIIKYLGIEYDAKRIKRVRLVPNLSISSPDESLAIWDIDGIIYEDPPNISYTQIEKVDVITSVAATTKYGMRGSGGVIVIRTKGAKATSSKKKNKKKKRKKAYANQYKPMQYRPAYFNVLDTISNKHTLYEQYNQLALRNKKIPSFFLDFAEYFSEEKKDDSLALKVLSEAQELFVKDPEVLKAIAYTYQKQGQYQKAIHLYSKLIGLRPAYAQSYRDLANAYTLDKQYKKAWDTYLRYVQNGNSVYEEGIEKTAYSEMSFLYSQKKNLSAIKDTPQIRDLNLSCAKSDIRIVFEWNTSEAEFEIEFVDPESGSFTFDHSLEKAPYRIVDEKDRGYSCNEFYFYKLSPGDWLVNVTYLGNKKYEPTYLKASIYRNWGKVDQTQEIKIFRLQRQNHKMELLKFNSKFSNPN